MRYTPIRRDTNQTAKADEQEDTANLKYQWLPRIKCNDCPGKVYTASPENAVENFEVHLKNRSHKDKVDTRRAKRSVAQQ